MRRRHRLKVLSKAMRYIGASLTVSAGIYYLRHPPNTTIGFFDASWPPMTWGVVMFLGGVVMIVGLINRIQQVEQYGTLMVALGSAMLSLAQTMVMLAPPITHTRGGGTLILWALAAFAAARYFQLSADIRSGKLAEKKMTTEGP